MRDAVREKHRKVHDMHQDALETKMSTEELDMVMIEFSISHSMQLKIISKLETKTN